MTIKGWQVAFLLAASPVFVQAQILLGPPSLSSSSIQSTGGITYFVYSATQPLCDWIQASAVTRSGSDFAVTLAEMQGEYCPECFECYYDETDALLFGHLPAGAYHLSVYSPNPFGYPLGTSLLSSMDFTVPASSGPTLVGTSDGDNVRIDVVGVPGANYVIEASAALTEWKPVYATRNAPFTFTTNWTAAPIQFYRVAVSSGGR